MSTEQFYDDLSESYHTLYPDWRREARTQGESLGRLVGRWHHGGVDVAVACGIGTQVIGLVALGHRVVGSDTSARAVARAVRECEADGVPARFAVADMRALPFADRCVDVVVCADNAMPHLLADDDVLAALAQMRDRPGRPRARPGARARRRPGDHPAPRDLVPVVPERRAGGPGEHGGPA